MNSKEIFQTAFALISDPATWIKGASARSADGLPVNAWDDDAVCWCSAGALAKVKIANYEATNTDPIKEELSYTAQQLDESLVDCDGDPAYIIFNDAPTHSHADVMRMWRETGERNNWL